MMIRFPFALFLLSTVTMLSFSAGSEEEDFFEKLISSHGYIYIENASGKIEISEGNYVLRVFLKLEGSQQYKSVIALVSDGKLVPIDYPVWSGTGISIDVSDINSDALSDVVVSEYYEPYFLIRVFFNGKKLEKVFQGRSFSKPKFVELINNKDFGNVQEMILTTDPYNASYDPLFVPKLYVFDGDEFVEYIPD